MTTWHEELLLIDGELVPASNGATYETVAPATEAVLGVAADATVSDAQRAIGAARRAFDTTEWSRDHALRVRCLRQLHQALRDNVEPLREILVHEV
ncbi:MAG TPA: aldehyde dehydrogenase family protein, partial [Acidimicrobiia bacterium]|nr:aldehyde dehydrogenase family protein [Acidimicrobiia bacterium]